MIPYSEDFHRTRTGPTLAADYLEAKRQVGDDDMWPVWPARVERDVVELGLTYEESLAKHRREWREALGLTSLFPAAPTRDQLLLGLTRQQGRTITLPRFGAFPWWGACWMWLTSEERASAAQQLLAAGDRICLMGYADGGVLYGEPGEFYTADKFGPLSATPEQHVAAVEEARMLGFDGVWMFFGGDDGNSGTGYPIAVAQTQAFSVALANSQFRDLNHDVVQIPGWDGVWHAPGPGYGTGYSADQIVSFAVEARKAGAQYVGVEHATGYLIPVSLLDGYDLILGEFNDDQFDGTVWQALGRMLPPGTYRMSPAQQQIIADGPSNPLYPQAHDLNPPSWLAGTNKVYRVFEFYIYGWVRGADPDHIEANRQQFEQMGAVGVC